MNIQNLDYSPNLIFDTSYTQGQVILTGNVNSITLSPGIKTGQSYQLIIYENSIGGWTWPRPANYTGQMVNYTGPNSSITYNLSWRNNKWIELSRLVSNYTPSVVAQVTQGSTLFPGNNLLSVYTTINISANSVVAMVNGQLTLANQIDVTHANNVLGLAVSGTLAGNIVPIQYSGYITYSGWNFIVGEPVFIGNNGMLTQTPPDFGFSQTIASVVNPTTLLIHLDSPVIIN